MLWKIDSVSRTMGNVTHKTEWSQISQITSLPRDPRRRPGRRGWPGPSGGPRTRAWGWPWWRSSCEADHRLCTPLPGTWLSASPLWCQLESTGSCKDSKFYRREKYYNINFKKTFVSFWNIHIIPVTFSKIKREVLHKYTALTILCHHRHCQSCLGFWQRLPDRSMLTRQMTTCLLLTLVMMLMSHLM